MRRKRGEEGKEEVKRGGKAHGVRRKIVKEKEGEREKGERRRRE